MRVLLFHLDGALPNLALMRLAAHHLSRGDEVELYRRPEPTIWDEVCPVGLVYGSAIFQKTRPAVERLKSAYPLALIGGTGWDLTLTLESLGVFTNDLDYSIYPGFRQSLGFTQRGCRLKCEFCVVPRKEGRVRAEQTIWDIWRGEGWPREVILLDNDFFGQPGWRDRIAEIHDGNFKVSFTQGINARCLTDEAAEAIASVDYRDDTFRNKCIHTAWDNRGDEARLFAGLNRLVKYGVRPHDITVYMLIGYWPNETAQDRDYRRKRLREFGCRPYPMPYQRTPELVGFQRWVVQSHDKTVAWPEWSKAQYEPRYLGWRDESQMRLEDQP